MKFVTSSASKFEECWRSRINCLYIFAVVFNLRDGVEIDMRPAVFRTRYISWGLDIEILLSIIHEVQYGVIQEYTRNQILRGFRETRSTKRYVIRGIYGVHYVDLCKAHDGSCIIAQAGVSMIRWARWLRKSMHLLHLLTIFNRYIVNLNSIGTRKFFL